MDPVRNARILSLMPLVTQLAYKVRRQAPSFEVADLISEGVIGAITAVDRWNPDEGELAPYASARIRGHIWDHIRDYSPLSRDHYKKVQEGEEEFFLGSIDQPISNSSDEGSMSLADLLPADEDVIAKMLDVMAIGAVMEQLPAKHRDMLQLYYFEGLTLQQIGDRYGVSESRISQRLGVATDYAYHLLETDD